MSGIRRLLSAARVGGLDACEFGTSRSCQEISTTDRILDIKVESQEKLDDFRTRSRIRPSCFCREETL